MELSQLRYLQAVVRTGSVTEAAALERISQPSMSKQVRALERELGVALFHRVGRRVVATDAARELAECAGRVFDEIEATAARVTGTAAGANGTLHLCATETVANHVLPAVFAALRQEFPGVRLRAEMLGTDDAAARVLADDVDFAIVPLPLADSRLVSEVLFEEEVFCAVAVGHAWSGRASISIPEVLASGELLLSMPGHGLRTQLDELSGQFSVEMAGLVEMRSQQALLAMAAAGSGIAIAPRIAVAGRTDIAAVPFSPGLSRKVGWIRRRGRHIPAAGLRLVEMVRHSE